MARRMSEGSREAQEEVQKRRGLAKDRRRAQFGSWWLATNAHRSEVRGRGVKAYSTVNSKGWRGGLETKE